MLTYAHQNKIVLENPKRRMLVWSTGSGKTLALLLLADKNVERVLIVVPKSNKAQWFAKFREYGIGPMNATIITKEEMRKEHARLERFDAVIVDEIHHFSGTTSTMHKNLLKYLKRTKPDFFWSGTATPYRSTPWNIYALARLHGIPLDYIAFRNRTHHPRYLGQRMIWEKNDDESTRAYLHGILTQFSDFFRIEDGFDMPDSIDMDPEEIEQTKAQKHTTAQLKKDESNPLVRVSKMHQIESGSLKGNAFVDDVIEIENGKDDRILELASEHPKLLVFCRFDLQIKRLSKKLSDAGYKTVILTGDNSADHFNLTLEAEAAQCCVVVAQISVAAGWELPSFGTVVYASMSYSLLEYQQSRGRVIRVNKPGKHVFMYLWGGPVDRAVYDSIMAKRDFDPVTFMSE